MLGWFVQWAGTDKSLGQVTREDCKAFGAALAYVPERLPGDAKIRLEIERAGKKRKRLSESAQAKYRGRVGSFMHYAAAEGWINKSPMPQMKREHVRGGSDRSYEPFTDEELARIFTAEYRSEAGGVAGKGVPAAARCWLPLIALYTGARIGEVAQLRVCNVREVGGGVWAFEFTDRGEGQSLKTRSSRRVVPMHSQLVDLGLREFVQRRSRAGGAKGSELLFREVGRNRNGWGGEGGALVSAVARQGRDQRPWEGLPLLPPYRVEQAQAAGRRTVSDRRCARSRQRDHVYGSVRREAGDLVPVVERLDFREPLQALFDECG